MKSNHDKNLFGFVAAFCGVAVMVQCSGCGMIGILGTPTRHEKKITAEYDLTKHRAENILVLVEQPSWVGAQANLRYELTKSLNHRLTEKIGIATEHLVSYDKLSRLRSSQPNYSVLSVPQIGVALKADLVLYALVESYEIRNMDHTNLRSGSLNVRAALYDSTTGEELWPESTGGKSIAVGFDVETGNRDAAVSRLVAAAAHCTVRYLYNCPQDEFGIFEDRSSVNW